MATIGVINDDGQEVEQRIFSKTANFEAQNSNGQTVVEFNPSITQRIKFDNKGQMSSITSECGETENRRQGDNKAKLTVEGIISGDDEVRAMRSLKNRETIQFSSDIFGGTVIVERLSIAQKSDLVYYKPNGGEKELAFSFQIQLKEP